MKKFFIVGFAVLLGNSVNSQNCNVICNGDFDNPTFVATVGLTTAVNCWNTEATDGKFEVWGTGYNGVSSYNGGQHLELNATQAAAIYQDFTIGANVPLISINFAHRGRAGVDSMEVSIGPPGGPYQSLGRYGDGSSAWGYYTINHTIAAAGNYRVRFKPVYWTGGNIAIGNFIDAVSVNSAAPITISSSNTLVCPGTAATLSASGANSYTWTAGPSTSTFVVNPSATSVYTVNGITSSGCIALGTFTVSTYVPALSINPGYASICQGSSITLTANVSNGSGFTWNGVPGQNTLTVSPSTNSIYTVTAFSSSASVNCPATATAMVYIKAIPQISLSTTSTFVCQGAAPVVISAFGGSLYSWSNGATTSTIQSAPVTTVYVVTGTNSLGCSATASIQVVVSVCEGLAENDLSSGVELYPNPNNGNFVIHALRDGNYTLVNALGQTIQQFECSAGNDLTVQLDAIPNGVYYLTETKAGTVTGKKIIISR